jgi:DNA invertase Pin-like site-specific DNA recombinase
VRPDSHGRAELTRRQVRLSLGGSVYDPHDPVGRLLFSVLAMVAEFEADVIRLRTREGMRMAKDKGKLRGKRPKLNPARRPTSWTSTARATTALPNWPICSA